MGARFLTAAAITLVALCAGSNLRAIADPAPRPEFNAAYQSASRAILGHDPALAQRIAGAAIKRAHALGDRYDEARFYLLLARSTDLANKPLVAVAHAKRAVSLAAAVRAPGLQSKALHLLYLYEFVQHIPNEDIARAYAVDKLNGDIRAQAEDLETMGLLGVRVREYPSALSLFAEAIGLRKRAGDWQKQEDDLQEMGQASEHIGAYQDAHVWFEGALQIDAAHHARAAGARAIRSLGDVSEDLGDFRGAENLYRTALGIDRKLAQTDAIIVDLHNLGTAQDMLHQWPAALASYREAAALAKRSHDRRMSATIYSSLGNLQDNMGLVREAISSYQKAIAYFRSVYDESDLAIGLDNIAMAQYHAGLYAAALKSSRESVALHEKNKMPVWKAYDVLASASVKMGDFTGAINSYDHALDNIEYVRGQLTDPDSRESFFSGTLYVYDNYLALLSALDNVDPGHGWDRKALRVFERRQGRITLEQVSLSGTHAFSGVPQQVLDEEARLAKEVSETEDAFTAASQRHADLRGPEAAWQRAQRAQQQFESDLRAHYKAYYALKHPQPLEIEALQALLAPDEAVAVFATLPNATDLWVVTHDAFHLMHLDLDQKALNAKVAAMLSGPLQIERDVDEHKSRAYVDSAAAANLPEFIKASSDLYRALFPAQATAMLRGASTVFIVPSGSLYHVPFESLVTETSPRYFIEDHAISYLSSTSELGALRNGLEKRRTGSRLPLLAFANPAFAPVVPTDAQTAAVTSHFTSRGADGGFPPLLGAEEEAAAVAAELHAGAGSVYTGESASKGELLKLDQTKDLTKYRYLLFATHAVLPGSIRELDQPALVLAHPEHNGYLQMSDVYGLSLQSDLVVLSACQSGGGTENSSEGVQGLTQAFMYAGTPSVAVTDWTVLDDVQKTFIPSFFQGLAGATPVATARALQSAKVRMIHGSDTALAHPFFWAGTVLFGDGDFST